MSSTLCLPDSWRFSERCHHHVHGTFVDFVLDDVVVEHHARLLPDAAMAVLHRFLHRIRPPVGPVLLPKRDIAWFLGAARLPWRDERWLGVATVFCMTPDRPDGQHVAGCRVRVRRYPAGWLSLEDFDGRHDRTYPDGN